MPLPKRTPTKQSRTIKPVRVKRRHKPGSGVLRDIRKYQKNGDLLILKLPFARLVRDITTIYTAEKPRIQATALLGITRSN